VGREGGGEQPDAETAAADAGTSAACRRTTASTAGAVPRSESRARARDPSRPLRPNP